MKRLHKHTNKCPNKIFIIGLLTVVTVLHLFEKSYIHYTPITLENLGFLLLTNSTFTNLNLGVRLVAERCGIETDLGIKQKVDIVKSMKTRAAFLSDNNHRIRFVYIPKHTSWLNQIECWFSILMRPLLKRGNLTSTTDLKQKILNFIAYYNRTFAKPFQWKFKGFLDGV